MSRFGLRSKTDGFKISEEKSSSNGKKLCKSAKVALKRVYQKNKKSSALPNAGATDTQDVSPAPSPHDKESSTAGRNNNNQPASTMVCSVPLNRIKGIIERLKLTNSKTKSKFKSQNNEDFKNNQQEDQIGLRERRFNDDEEEYDGDEGRVGDGEGGDYQKKEEHQQQPIMKMLCLYCDKQFTSHKMQVKHVEKFHTQHKDRRCSGRNSQTPPHELKKTKQHSMQQNFPGCTFCKKTKAPQLISAPAKELHGLFVHLTACHADRYFGCKACTLRFQNVTKLAKHMQSVHNERLLLPHSASTVVAATVGEERSPMTTKTNDSTDPLLSLSSNAAASKRETKTRLQKSQKASCGAATSNTANTALQQQNVAAVVTLISTATTAASSTIIGAEEPILSRLGLTQNRLPNNRARGVRIRRNGGGGETILSEVLLKSDQTPSVAAVSVPASLSSLSSTTSPLKARSGKSAKSGAATFSSIGETEVVFRVPTRTEILSCVIDDDFYKEVVANVRSNLQEHLDGKLLTSGHSTSNACAPLVNRRNTLTQQQQQEVRSTMLLNGENCELHAATSLAAVTAFPTLLTAQQYGDAASGSSKIRRRPHTKHSWKWKWDSVKKFKLINEGGRIIKKMKQPLLGGGLRDLSKLDTWTQLTMRQKHEQQEHYEAASTSASFWQRSSRNAVLASLSNGDTMREERQRLNEQLNFILDMRLLPHIILEQNEQAIIKLENDEFGCGGSASSDTIARAADDYAVSDDIIGGQSFTDARFLSLLQLMPRNSEDDARAPLTTRPRLVLSGEWARPRCYLCMCCGAKFEKLKSLEEHKMFRHSHIYSTHYEVVGRELLAANLLRHFFIPKRALSRYSRDINMPVAAATLSSGVMRRFAWSKNCNSRGGINIGVSAEDESSDSAQSILNSCSTVTHAYNVKSSSQTSTVTTTDDCDDTTDTKNALVLLDINTASPSHSMQSASSSSLATATATTPMAATTYTKQHKEQQCAAAISCSKCSRKCSGVLDLYRHMLDCSGDYIWSLAKKRKYRYYCGGSKKRRPCNKHQNFAAELRKQCKQKNPKTQSQHVANAVDTEESGSNCSKTKTPPRQRPSDAESIKKMLENLPAKRVCKKIFPTVTKAKKSKKSKLIAKHKMYNTQVLRKTRARQISQTTKMLSKTKNQFSNKMSTTQGLIVLKRKNKNVRVLSHTKTKKNSSQLVANTSIPLEVDSTNLFQMQKSYSQKEKEVQINEIKQNDDAEKNDSVPELLKINSFVTLPTAAITNHHTGLETITVVSSTAPKAMQEIDASGRTNDGLRSKKCEQSVVPQNIIPPPSLNLACAGPKIQISPQMENLNSNKKRSKKINDCIAMLTGKLEEKLKTEQKVVASTKEIFTESELKIAATTASNEKKTPKRKTTSRRIIKPDTLNPKLQLNPPKNVILLTPTVPAIVTVSATETVNKEIISVPVVTQAAPFPLPVFSATVSVPPVPGVPQAKNNMLPKIPLYLTVKNFKTTASTLVPPLSLPIPSMPLSQVEMVPVMSTAAITLLHPPPPPPPLLQQMHFNVEPLNLSSSNCALQKQNSSQNIQCLTTQHRTNMPARRQTICGFEARNIIEFDEMEPLDLSKNSKKDQTQPPLPLLLARTIENVNNVPLEFPCHNSEPTIQPPPLLPPSLAISLPPEILLNKQFYSNLDLLKIPQVRNPAFISSTEIPSAKSVTTTTTTTTATTTSKKRNNSKNFTELPMNPTTTNIPGKSNANLSTPKKDNTAKTKITQKMDDVVINHIDDAINSVINAVKASLSPDNAEENAELQRIQLNLNQKEHQLVNAAPQNSLFYQPQIVAPVAERELKTVVPQPPLTLSLKNSTPQKRCMRSKTLDCRPVALVAQATTNTLQQNQMFTPPPVVNVINVTVHTETDAAPMLNTSVAKQSSDDICTTPDKCTKQSTPNIAASPFVNTTINHLEEVEISEKSTLSEERLRSVEDSKVVSSDQPRLKIPKSDVVVDAASTTPDDDIKSPILPISHETNVNSISEENISIINNTSSGFHSSGQSEIFADSKKKQRRRRKNELAAIVADQLLESFKIDKARRDNLKKLENLAYEKSEDLLLTGMLLMSSTKRNASSAFPSSGVQTSSTTTSTTVNDKATDKNVDSLKRQKPEAAKNLKNKTKSTVETIKSGKPDKKIAENSEKDIVKLITVSDNDNEVSYKQPGVVILDNKEKDVDPKKSKRRQYRRRGKTLDNENISKLKSSLESFSIGIERQLTEIEAAKNANVFNVNDPKTRNAVIAASAAKTASILRPSILSATLEQPSNNSKAAQSSGESGKTVVSSRDPRLNKNIHKDDEKETTDDTDVSGIQSIIPTKSRLRSAAAATSTATEAKNMEEIGDFEEDNYLTEIAKNVNEKMTAENEEFVFANDGFEMANDLQDDSNSKYYRPSTSMSVRSAPNFNDDRSNFGSICDENTNTEVMDMDLDDDMSVYTSYSQDVGRGGRGRRRRRRRSILLKRKPKKQPSNDLYGEKFECALCKKTFFTANSLGKHNMTLAHVSKVSELEYLQSKSMPAGGVNDELKTSSQISTISQNHSLRKNTKEPKETATTSWSLVNNVNKTNAIETVRAIWGEDANRTNDYPLKQPTTLPTPQTTIIEISNEKNTSFNSTPRLTLNPDERLFFECCNILKGAETPRISSEDCNNVATYTYAYQQDKIPIPCMTGTSLKPPPPSVAVVDVISPRKQSVSERPSYKTIPAQTMQTSLFRDPQMIPSSLNKHAAINNTNEQNLLSANYSAISQFSAVTNTTSRFKTKAAMKGYENVNVNLTIQQELETKFRTVCKLTELAEIALGNEKPNSPEFSHHATDLRDESNSKRLNQTEYNNLLSVVDNQKDFNLNRERQKNTEAQSSTSSKTIMHSSIIKAAVEEHRKVPSVGKIVIPDRPFKNIGLEEKETITFQKPKTTVNLLTDDNSVSTASYSDRDDFDFGSMSCDEDASIKTSNEKNVKNNSSDSSSSRATAKTFENKSLIMGRIFKNASTKPKIVAPAVKFKSVGVQKDQTPKADLNQLFDELRGGDNVGKTKSSEASERKEINLAITEDVKDKHTATKTNTVAAPTCVVEQTVAARTKVKDTRAKKASIVKGKGGSRKNQKDISKMQSELGMSQQEIEKLIDEGQRKSKRRCATNRPKKLVEIWSSDEYEEFLSTKDIIALIEEKEKQENKKKRKNSINENKEKDSDVLHTTVMTTTIEKRKSLKFNNVNVQAKEKTVTAPLPENAAYNLKESQRLNESTIAAAATGKKHKTLTASTVAIGKVKQASCNPLSRPDEKVTKPKTNLKSNQSNGSSRLRNYKNIDTAPSKPKIPKTTDNDVAAIAVSTESAKQNSKPITDGAKDKSVLRIEEDDLCLSHLAKRNSNHRTRDNKYKKGSASTEDVNNVRAFSKVVVKDGKEGTVVDVVPKKRSSNKTYKNKRKIQPNQSPPRRKRLAAEKLYYWSSSSDEDFGRINTSDAQEFESGEQYQKHGWIVGDSHKKLVTLLAIAKGNKKVENCGVKKNISKKKS